MASITGKPSSKADRFLWRLALFMLFYCVIGFGLRAVTDDATQARLTAPVVGHALLMTAWLVLFAWQITLRQAGQVALHRKVGKFGAVLAVAVVTIGILISTSAGLEFEDPFFFGLNTGAFIGFGMLVMVAIRAGGSGNVERHRRFMLVATLLFLGPATGRWLPLIGAPSLLAPPLLLLFLIVLPLVYDRLAEARWTGASKAASAIAIASVLLGAGSGAALMASG